MTDFEFTTEVQIRYKDLDPWDHVNNGVFGSYMEEGRSAYLDAVLGERKDLRSFVLAHLEIDFERPVFYEDDLLVAVRTAAVGTSSLTLAYELRTGDGVAATGETTQVHMGADDSPTPLPAAWRESIERFEPGL
ncbi:MAG: acyl-CoA thioesterase [Haloarculaceae archaeon]